MIEKQYSKLAYLYVQADKAIGNSTAIVKVSEVRLQSKVLSTSETLETFAKEGVDPFKKGSKGDEVKLIQEALLMLNFDLGKYGADGHFGSGTHKVIVSFQEKFIPTHEIHPNYKIKEANGIVDSQTLLAIDEAVAIGWIKPIPPFKWCEPLLNPMSTNYYQSGGGGTKKARAWGLFGKKIRGTSRHDGLDLFAKAGTDVFACVDGEIAMNYKIPGPGYGHVVLLKVAESELMWENRKEFSARKNLTDVELEQYDTFESEYKKNKQLYLMYAHLSSVESKLKVGSSVKVGEIIAKTGVSGIKETGVIKAGTCAPHLHFEVRTKASIPKSDMGRCNPSLFVNFKDYSQQSEAERKQQKDERDRQYKILKK
ncbi:peptidoglycan DD-metalloendopeptidase family protein [Vibrio sp. Of7-15]|uniref:peptidoglycan DD-metalloendopeptidase family protein n=1 Tax=Vibrio sp. Of7-15 TaxID=2724879 RepID=UPI001EF29892|nr:peptidoglycan DD-metalloendopeptidase family protein [Vibrio sp. Of7-15]MCG7497313.1 peptidoglycan DD-metalloendopeptidase family protein [Vibrio sp. Of7-15]